MICDLDRRLPPRTRRAAVDGMIRRSLELLRRKNGDDARLSVAHDLGVGIHDADGEAAARRAHRADARLPGRNAGNDVLRRNETYELVLRIAAARERGARR